MVKKILKFFALVAGVAIVAFAVSLLVSLPSDNSQKIDDSSLERFNEPVGEYSPQSRAPVKITPEEANFAFSMPNSTKIRYYHARSGGIKEVDIMDPKSPELIATIKPMASYITWSPNGSELIAQYGAEYRHINLKTGKDTKLAGNIFFPVFSKSSTDVAYLYFDDNAGEGDISVADSSFASFKNILKTRLKSWEIYWNSGRRLSLIATSASDNLASVFMLDIENKELSQLLENQRELRVLSSPDGSKILYSRKARTGIVLSVLSVSENSRVDLKISTSSDKCAWSSDSTTIYCAVPSDKDDSFYKIPLSTMEAQEILSADEAGFADAREMFYINALPALVFKNFKDGRLYLIQLQK